MACWNCPRYCRTERRCRDGKSNPRRKSDSIAVAEALGLRALCHYNTHRDALALRMFFPLDPFTVQASARSRKRARRSAEPLVGPPPERAEAVRDPE
jgi:hypothetical protein